MLLFRHENQKTYCHPHKTLFMKKNLFIIFLLLLGVAGVIFSCKKNEPKHSDKPVDNPIGTFPQDIVFTEYLLNGTECRWVNLPNNEKVVVINSQAEMKEYINCSTGSYPEVDFSKHTLLLASGGCPKGVVGVSAQKLTQHSSEKLSMELEVTLYENADKNTWAAAFIVEKLNKNSKVKLNITTNEKEVVYPIDIPYKVYSLEGSSCDWNFGTTYPYQYSIINSDEKLKQFFNCSYPANYPKIDFLKQTLILVYSWGGQNFEKHVDSVSFQQIEKQKYKMEVYITRTNIINSSKWQASILIDKIVSHSIVQFKIVEN